MNFSNNTVKKTEPCKIEHGINGMKPAETDLQYDGKTCDCGKLVYHLEECGCPGKKHMLLKEKENPDYKPSY